MADISLLNPSDALSATFDVLPISPDSVAMRAARRRGLSREEVLALRQIKNLLTPALELADRLGRRRMLGWAEVYRALP